MDYEVAIIGGGVVGCAILNKLTRHGVSCVLLEKANDVAMGASKANSGIVHAGFDCKPNTLKARFNVRGNQLFHTLCPQLKVPLKQCGAIVVGNDQSVVEDLYNRGIANKVEGLSILDRAGLLELVPNLNENITCGLYAKTSCIVSPYMFTIALAEEAVINGAKVLFNTQVKQCKKVDELFNLVGDNLDIKVKYVINSAASGYNDVANILGSENYEIKYRRGEYFLLDNTVDITDLTIFPLPSKAGKGVLISPTADGNTIVGPTSIPSDDSTMTTTDGLNDVKLKSKMILDVPFNKNIRNFAGVRVTVGDDFVIEKSNKQQGVINIAGICSPGLSSAPAIAEYVVEDLLGYKGKEIDVKPRTPYTVLSQLSGEERNKLIKSNSDYGKIVCKCECVSLGEIKEALNSPLKPNSVDAIKRRVRAGMGRCQGGFCLTKVIQTISQTLNIPMDNVVKENMGSNYYVSSINPEIKE